MLYKLAVRRVTYSSTSFDIVNCANAPSGEESMPSSRHAWGIVEENGSQSIWPQALHWNTFGCKSLVKVWKKMALWFEPMRKLVSTEQSNMDRVPERVPSIKLIQVQCPMSDTNVGGQSKRFAISKSSSRIRFLSFHLL